MKRVEVRWIDSAAGDRWVEPETLKGRKAATCVSVGFLADENEDAITIVQSIGEGEDGAEEYGHPLTIPTVALLSDPHVLHSGRVDWTGGES